MPSHGVAEYDARYIAYQKRYQGKVRESDRWLANRVIKAVEGLDHPIIMDMGCSTGNFLSYLKSVLTGSAFLWGIDIVEDYINSCVQRDDLSGIFETRDILSGPFEKQAFDVVVANMSMMFMNNSDYEKATKNMVSGLKSGGSLFIMDYIHDYPHEIEVTEKTETVPFNVTFRLRPKTMLEWMCERSGLQKPTFEEFFMPYELQSEGIQTHTKRLEDGRNLSFRGALYQPWCLMKARKS